MASLKAEAIATPVARVNEYEIISAASPEEVVKKTNAYLKKGWRLQGGIGVAAAQKGQQKINKFFAQAVVR